MGLFLIFGGLGLPNFRFLFICLAVILCSVGCNKNGSTTKLSQNNYYVLSATSSDGLEWRKQEKVLFKSSGLLEVWLLKKERIMLYCPSSQGIFFKSLDGVKFTPATLKLDKEAITTLDDLQDKLGIDLCVASFTNGKYRLYFTKRSPEPSGSGRSGGGSGKTRIESAISDDGINWQKEKGIRFETGEIDGFNVVMIGNTWRLYYLAKGNVYSATSRSGLNFRKDKGVRLKKAKAISVVYVGDGYRAYCQTTDNKMLSAVSIDGFDWQEEPGFRLDKGQGQSLDKFGIEKPAVVNLEAGNYLAYYLSRAKKAH